MSETRARIARQIRTEPGIHFNELVRSLDLAPGQVQYHLRKLLSDVQFTERRLRGRTHYFPAEYDEWEQGALAALHRETAADVVAVLLERGPTRPAAVAEALGIARSTLEWHLDHLVERDVVAKRRDDRGRVTLLLARPAETVRLLEASRPSVPGRLVDRFERLVDSLLGDRDGSFSRN